MIVPMKKFTFLAHHTDYANFLNELRNRGLLHIHYREATPSEELLKRIQVHRKIKDTLQALRTRMVTRQKTALLKERDGWQIVQSFREQSEKLELLEAERKGLVKELDFLKPWGGFSVESIDRLREAGLEVHFYISPVKKYQTIWESQFPLQVIDTLPPDIYFVIVVPKGENLSIDAEEIPVPEVSPYQLKARCQVIEKQMERINHLLDLYALYGQSAVEMALNEAENTTQLTTVIENTQRKAEGRVMLLEGFAPAYREKEIMLLCEGQSVPVLSEKAKPEDNPPVLLKNTAFSRLFEPIGKLFSLPAYQELDLTPYFAPFFMMFFGFCLGDAGYGLVVLLGASLYKFKAHEKIKPVLSLAQFLGTATIIFGMLTGTFFGLNLLDRPFEALGQIRKFMLNSDQTFQLALVLGLTQILFGLLIQAINKARQFGWIYAASPVGWIILLLSILDLSMLKWTAGFSSYTAWMGVVVILFLSEPKGNIFNRLGQGIWQLYGITGFFGDLLSYIRLFALGISSAILGFVVNDISLQIKDGIPYLGPVIFVVFLVVGHGANLLISALGSFVHPMRLTFVEFYKNAGFTGGGKAYQPLSRKNAD